jgi:hypothetical protein
MFFKNFDKPTEEEELRERGFLNNHNDSKQSLISDLKKELDQVEKQIEFLKFIEEVFIDRVSNANLLVDKMILMHDHGYTIIRHAEAKARKYLNQDWFKNNIILSYGHEKNSDIPIYFIPKNILEIYQNIKPP